jgi:hypothetical protein
LCRQSPAAFYVYSTVRIITAAAITDDGGNLACGTAIGGFLNLNSNAQAYFGGAGASPIYRPAGDPDVNPRAPTLVAPAIITLATPFIYQPARGRLGTTISEACGGKIAPDTEDYGYVPQTVLDHLIGNKDIAAQYPGLSACLPAGPSIKAINCGTVEFVTTTIIGSPLPVITQVEISTRTVFFNRTTTLPGTTGLTTSFFNVTLTYTMTIPGPTVTISSSPTAFYPTYHERSVRSAFTPEYHKINSPAFPTLKYHKRDSSILSPTPTPVGTSPQGTTQASPTTENNPTPQPLYSAVTRVSTASLVFFTSIPERLIVNPGSSLERETITNLITPTGTASVIVSPVTLARPPPGTATIPTYVSASEPRLVDPIVSIYVAPVDGAPESAVELGPPGPGPAPDLPPNQVDSQGKSIGSIICQIIGCVAGQSATPVAQGSGPSVVVSPTTFRLQDAPLGLTGQISTIDGTGVLIVPSQETFVPFNPTASPIPGALVTIINGSPSIVISFPTLVPAVNAPPQLSNAPITIINNTPYLVVGPTTFAAPSSQANGATTTNIGGTNFIVFPSATNIPLLNAPPGKLISKAPWKMENLSLLTSSPGLTGSLTIINNTPYLAVPGSTNIAIPATETGTLATTVINGTPFVIVGGPTQIPLVNAPSGLTGVTTIINGTPFLIIPSATALPLPTSPSNEGQVTVINGVTEIILTGIATLPVNSAYSLSGLTTFISGVTEVIISTPTTISLRTISSSTLTSSELSSTSTFLSSISSTRSSSSARISSKISTSASHTPTILPSNSSSGKGLSIRAKVGIAIGVLLFVALVIGLIFFLRRRGQVRGQYDPVAAGDDGGAAPPVVEHIRTSTQIGADSYTPVVHTRGGYMPAPQQEWMSTMRRQSARRPVRVEVAG